MKASVASIIRCLDHHLEGSGKPFLTAPEANEVLAKAGLLGDRSSRAGAPLRILLRTGQLPHAYKDGGRWVIPHSGAGHRQPSVQPSTAEAKQHARSDEPTVPGPASGIDAARAGYRPKIVKCLLIAEAPPDALARFFYYAPVSAHDHLFLGVMEVLYPAEKAAYLAARRPEEMKRRMLQRFREDGFFLMDVSDVPLSRASVSLRTAAGSLVERVGAIATPDTPIILIKATTFAVAHGPLRRAGYTKVNSEPIPFPGQGWQPQFREGFVSALRGFGLA